MGSRRRWPSTKGATVLVLWGLVLPQVHLVAAEDLTTPLSAGKFGDRCRSETDCTFDGASCEYGRCTCRTDLPATNQLDKCGLGVKLNETCSFHEQCELMNPLTECRDNLCICRFEKQGIIHPDGSTECITIITDTAEEYVAPTMIAILVVMCLMFIILCVVLRLFSRARWRENRTIFNTPNPRLMNVSLLRDSKHGDRRGSKTSIRASSRHGSTGSLRPHSPSMQGSRGDSKAGSNGSINKSPPPAPTSTANTPVLENVTVEVRNAKA